MYAFKAMQSLILFMSILSVCLSEILQYCLAAVIFINEILLTHASYISLHCVPKKHVTTFSAITLTIGVRLQ